MKSGRVCRMRVKAMGNALKTQDREKVLLDAYKRAAVKYAAALEGEKGLKRGSAELLEQELVSERCSFKVLTAAAAYGGFILRKKGKP